MNDLRETTRSAKVVPEGHIPLREALQPVAHDLSDEKLKNQLAILRKTAQWEKFIREFMPTREVGK